MPVRMSGLVSNLDTDSIIASLMSVQRTKSTKIENKITKMEWKQEKWKALNSKIYSFYTDSLSKMRMQSSFATKKVSSSDETVATVTASNSAPEGTHSLKVKQMASAQFVTSGQLLADENSKAVSLSTKLTDLNMTAGNKITVNAGGTIKTLDITDATTVSDFVSTLKDAGLNASYDSTQKRFFISSKESGYANAFSLTATNPAELSGLKLGEIVNTDLGGGVTSVTGGGAATLIPPKDAVFIYNQVELTSSSNNVTANGLAFTLKGTTDGLDTVTEADDEVVSLNVSNDTQAVYDTFKSFVTKYNDLLKEMNTDYYADTAAGYNPLTDDEKKAMTDDEISQWETKIKSSLLRRDNSLGSIINTMRTKLSTNVNVNGSTYTLSSFGIKTSSDYLEKGLLHIDGNKDDSSVAVNEDKLLAAITKDPDTVMKVMTELAGNLYDSITKSMSSTNLRSAMTVYNDKEMKTTITDYKSNLADTEKYLKNMEDRYYKQYSAMETALSKMNSQSSYLASMMGTSK